MNEIEKAITYFEALLERLGNGDSDNAVCATALAALREQAERENGCEFCQRPYKSIDSGKGGNEKSILYMGGSSPYANLSKKYLHFMDAAGRMDLFEVKYCPMCGKRLEVEHE